eukprot:11853544-Ditylum_brightwellii.AAC.1
MPHYAQNKQSIIGINDANNSSDSSSIESTPKQNKCKKIIKETKKANNLRDTTIDSYFSKKRGETIFEKG